MNKYPTITSIWKDRLLEIVFCVLLILFISNLNAIVDVIIHPEIPYFDEEHLIVGSITGIFCFALFGLALMYFSWLHKSNFERKLAEDAIMESEEKFKALFDRAIDGIFQLTDKGEIIAVNEAFAKMHGYTVDEMLKMSLKDIDTPATSQLTPARMQRVLAGESLTFDVEHFCKNGQIIPFEVTTNTLPIGEKKYILGFHRDIRVRQQAENEIKHKNDELQKLNAEKDKFFSIIAHDLRSPFNSLLGFTQLMEEELPTMTKEQIQNIAISMRRSATNVYRLLENLLDWSRLQRGIIHYNPEPALLLPKILADTALVMGSANKKGIDISCKIPDDLLVCADEHMLDCIIRNLAGNAVKFTPRGGKITIEAMPMDDNWVEISVKDTGVGIRKEMVEKLFDMDSNTNRKGTEGENSTGLGLIISKEFIEKHGGKLWVESEEGKGSTFHFTLPGSLHLTP